MKKRASIHNSVPNSSPDNPTIIAWARLIRVGRTLLDTVEADLKREGLPPLSYYDALLELRRAGDRGLRPFELQSEMLLAQYNVSRLVDRLTKAGLITRKSTLDDGRGQVLRITQAGKDQLRLMWPVYRKAIEKQVGTRLAENETKVLVKLLAKLLPDKQVGTQQRRRGEK